jgi:hypothetical protein
VRGRQGVVWSESVHHWHYVVPAYW